jgi:hypothetical protein
MSGTINLAWHAGAKVGVGGPQPCHGTGVQRNRQSRDVLAETVRKYVFVMLPLALIVTSIIIAEKNWQENPS